MYLMYVPASLRPKLRKRRSAMMSNAFALFLFLFAKSWLLLTFNIFFYLWTLLSLFLMLASASSLKIETCSRLNNDLLLYPIPSCPGWTNWPINEFYVSKHNWWLFFSCHNIHVYSTSNTYSFFSIIFSVTLILPPFQ